MAENKLVVASTPYVRNGETSHCLMFDALLATLPAIVCSVYYFGFRSLLVMSVAVFSAVFTEAGIQIIFKCRKFDFKDFLYSFATSDEITSLDGSAVVTGLLLAFTLPPTVPLWIPAIGSAFGMIVAKHLFGGIGYNIFNPALAGRAFLLAAWPALMTAWQDPIVWGAAGAIDAVSTATPLTALKMSGQTTPLVYMLMGKTGGCLGETSAVALLIGASYLLYKRTITWHIPVSYFGTMIILSVLLGQNPLFHLLAGGVMLGALYMATDPVTSPVTSRGRIIFGCGAGLITMMIRLYGGYPEGTCYAILIMNGLNPLIEKYTSPKFKPDAIGVPLVDKIVK